MIRTTASPSSLYSPIWSLYRDDGLAVVYQPSGPKLDRLRKDIISLFKSEGLSITIDTNLTETDFLDVSLNLTNGSYSPYRKPDNYLYSPYKSIAQVDQIHHGG